MYEDVGTVNNVEPEEILNVKVNELEEVKEIYEAEELVEFKDVVVIDDLDDAYKVEDFEEVNEVKEIEEAMKVKKAEEVTKVDKVEEFDENVVVDYNESEDVIGEGINESNTVVEYVKIPKLESVSL